MRAQQRGLRTALAAAAGLLQPAGTAPPATAAGGGPWCPGAATRGLASHTRGSGGWHRDRHQGEPGAWCEFGHEYSHHATDTSTPHLYSLHASELQQQHYLLSVAARRAAAQAEAEAGVGDRYVPVESLAAGEGYEVPSRASKPRATTLSEDEEAAAVELHCAQCGPLSEPDFYEGVDDFSSDNQLVLRSTWLCSGASSLADMRMRLEERIRFLADLETDGWELMEAVDDEFACLHNKQPKPRSERRLAEAWEIVERWEQSIEWERWPGHAKGY